MSYRIEFLEEALKGLRKMDLTGRRQILKYLFHILSRVDDPRLLGKALTGNYGGFWRYRTGHFRIICKIDDDKLIIMYVEKDLRYEENNENVRV